jgi:hypothetical protein
MLRRNFTQFSYIIISPVAGTTDYAYAGWVI